MSEEEACEGKWQEKDANCKECSTPTEQDTEKHQRCLNTKQ